MRVEKRINEIVNRLNRTKVERRPDLKGESLISASCIFMNLRNAGFLIFFFSLRRIELGSD